MYVQTELARSLAVWACWAIDAGDPGAAVAASAAKSFAGPAAVLRVRERRSRSTAGLGFTWDSELHRFYKRAQWLDAFEGSRGVQRAAIADAIFGEVAA